MPEFWQFPTVTLEANYQTEIYLTYDTENVYQVDVFSQGISTSFQPSEVLEAGQR
jgi:hypothetical protein